MVRETRRDDLEVRTRDDLGEWRPMIEVQELRKSFGQIKALDGVSFSIPEGTIYGLLGPNGAGKTTTIGILAGLIQPSGGSATVAGHDVVTDAQEAKRALGLVPQDVVLYDELNARENLEFFGGLYRLRGAALRRRVDELLEVTELGEHAKRQVQTYSGGMRRRLNLACGLVHEPRVILLDEPTVGIDPHARLHILQLVRNIAHEGTTILYTTHYLHEAEELCSRIAIIDHGRIIAEGTLDELRAQVGGRDLITIRGRFDKLPARNRLESLADTEIITVEEDEVVLECKQGNDNVGKLMQVLSEVGETHQFNLRQPSLENLFIKLTGRELRE